MKLFQIILGLALITALSACLEPTREPGSVVPGGGSLGSSDATPSDNGNGDSDGAALSYTAFVQPFFDQWCTSCHSEAAGILPLLETYDDAFDHAEINLELMELPMDDANYMPPGRELPAAELQQYRDWLEAGKPEN